MDSYQPYTHDLQLTPRKLENDAENIHLHMLWLILVKNLTPFNADLLKSQCASISLCQL